jgi:signal transduction histidine kinase
MMITFLSVLLIQEKGIAEENLSKLFHKFHQIESAQENEEGGTGLGLAISKEIITFRHGGKDLG